MKILHTADWHLGRMLYSKKRYEEFEAFFDWLILMMEEDQIHVLLIDLDVFDSMTSIKRSQLLYYSFMRRVKRTGYRYVVIVSGNHDSPTFLDAPRQVLQA